MRKTWMVPFFLGLIFLQCLSSFQKSQYINISCNDAKDLIEASQEDTNFVVIDFRSGKDFNKFHLQGAIQPTSHNNTVDNWLDLQDKQKRYLIYCQYGFKSKAMFKKMKEMEFKNIYHLYWGIKECNKHKLSE